MPIASGANSWPKSYWTKPEEKEVAPPPARRERASIAEGFLAERRKRFVKQRSVPVTSYGTASSSVVFVHPHQLTINTTTSQQVPPPTEVGDVFAVWEGEEQMMAIPGFCSSSSSATVEPFCPTHQETIESHRQSIAPNNEGEETKRQTVVDEEKEGDTGNQQHTLSITENRESVDDNDDMWNSRWNSRWCGVGRGDMPRKRIRRSCWCLVVLMTVIVLTTAAVITLMMVLMTGRRASDGSVIETAKLNGRRWIDDVFFDFTGLGDDGQPLHVELYFQKLTQFGKACLSLASFKEDPDVIGSSCSS